MYACVCVCVCVCVHLRRLCELLQTSLLNPPPLSFPALLHLGTHQNVTFSDSENISSRGLERLCNFEHRGGGGGVFLIASQDLDISERPLRGRERRERERERGLGNKIKSRVGGEVPQCHQLSLGAHIVLIFIFGSKGYVIYVA